MRAARNSENTKNIFLYVNVIIVGNAFNITATSESCNGSGQKYWLGRNLGYWFHRHSRKQCKLIISSVAQVTDKFIDEYLRVNEAACG